MVTGHSSPWILMQITKLMGGRGGPVQPQLLCSLLWINGSMLEWRKEGIRKTHYSRRPILFPWQDGEEGDSGQKKIKNTIASFLCFQVSHLTLLMLPVHLSLGKKRVAGFAWRHHGEKEDEHWPGPGNKWLFSSNVTRSPLEGEKEAMQRTDRFPITRNHSFFQRLRASGAHPLFYCLLLQA